MAAMAVMPASSIGIIGAVEPMGVARTRNRATVTSAKTAAANSDLLTFIASRQHSLEVFEHCLNTEHGHDPEADGKRSFRRVA